MQLETLSDVWTHGARIVVRCAFGRPPTMKRLQPCAYTATLDTETLVCTRGRDFPVALLASRMRCPRCGSRRVSVIFDLPPNHQRMGAAAMLKRQTDW
jgi:hypothetical protein